MGSLEEYVRAGRDVLAGKVVVDWGGAIEDDGIWKETGVDISPEAILHAPMYFGRDVRVESGASSTVPAWWGTTAW